ncbi:putative baseplate assembly protein [Longimicrobium sp.]|uniref:putative baseplate assembly protein n=1 Tax=Longimicrobium sp. TaxID=2029185 RepID=UPI002BC1FB76|nr:putative baseplate assembly protein [Longimicrobium sp.]HSU13664.1 putative baseplate assembly protein [Longimicrobium sp.]
MKSQLYCPSDTRRALVRQDGTLNGIDFLEVLDTSSIPPRQQTLLVHCFLPVTALTAASVRIEGGVRVQGVAVEWALPASEVLAGQPDAAESNRLKNTLQALDDDPQNVLVVRTDRAGDFSTYTLRLVDSGPGAADLPPKGFDPQLSEVAFSFKVECPSEFDCRPREGCAEPAATPPPIDYLAKDYASFRRLMLDRMAVTMPGWSERNAADLGIALVEVLAYAADHLSYYQDAVATEAYLGTARRRVSVRRHARLVDYFMHDGANARTWVTFEVEPASDADGEVLQPGTQLLTEAATPLSTEVTGDDPAQTAEDAGALVFETLHPVTLRAANSRIRVHNWGDERCCLPRGATRATLVRLNEGGLVDLRPGDVLVFEEVRSPESRAEADADPRHRHAVRLTRVVETEDPLFTEDDPTQLLRVLEVSWDPQDALPFTLCLWDVADSSDPDLLHAVSVARGNVVLADHGRTVAEELDELTASARYRPRLARAPLTRQARATDAAGNSVAVDPAKPAIAAFQREMGDVRPWIRLESPETPGAVWDPRPDLLGSDRFATEFVVESEEDGTTFLRFGDGLAGRLPVSNLAATYRVGNGRAGNVGADAITRLVDAPQGVVRVRNPLPAAGGEDPEPLADVRKYAPTAFLRQERAVTEADYAEMAQRHPEVQRAAATRRWTGSWYTVFVSIDRRGGCAVDQAFRDEMRAFLEPFRLAGHDLEIDSPQFVPLDVVLAVCVKPGFFRADVKRALLDVFGSGTTPDGQRAFFHPDNLTFGQPVYLSRLIAAAMQVPGVSFVQPKTFQRWGQPARGELAGGAIVLDRLEIARMDNDPSLPENGKIDFQMEGGL